jgi:AcrR family transcriptional regulator
MPRVSEAHLAARRQQILDAARTCFLRKGFHLTSMQDVIVEAGLSVGAVYRYFKSKNDIIEAIADQYADEIGSMLEDLVADPASTLPDVMLAAATVIDANTGPDGAMRIAVQVWGEAMRDERAAATARKVYTRFRANFEYLARRAVQAGELPADTDPEATGAVLFALVIGYGLQKLLTGKPDLDTYLGGLRTLLAK